MTERSGGVRSGVRCNAAPVARLTVHRDARARWPTPTVSDATRGGERRGIPERVLASATPVAGHNVSLQHAVRLWPTPSAGMWKQDVADGGAYARRVQASGFQCMLPAAVKLAPDYDGDLGVLNPPWVEWLMGFPNDWTDLRRSA